MDFPGVILVEMALGLLGLLLLSLIFLSALYTRKR